MTSDDILAALRHVDDPEMGLNVVDLGLVYGVEVVGDTVHVALTLTSPTCSHGSSLADAAQAAIREHVPGAAEVEVSLVGHPPWTPELMSAQGKRELGWRRVARRGT